MIKAFPVYHLVPLIYRCMRLGLESHKTLTHKTWTRVSKHVPAQTCADSRHICFETGSVSGLWSFSQEQLETQKPDCYFCPLVQTIHSHPPFFSFLPPPPSSLQVCSCLILLLRVESGIVVQTEYYILIQNIRNYLGDHLVQSSAYCIPHQWLPSLFLKNIQTRQTFIILSSHWHLKLFRCLFSGMFTTTRTSGAFTLLGLRLNRIVPTVELNVKKIIYSYRVINDIRNNYLP